MGVLTQRLSPLPFLLLVAMSVTKLLSRYVFMPSQSRASSVSLSRLSFDTSIVAPVASTSSSSNERAHHKSSHDHTYGITSDPITHFACVFSALIHDVEHQGVPNAQLVKEGVDVAMKYNNISVAEQNSGTWNLRPS